MTIRIALIFTALTFAACKKNIDQQFSPEDASKSASANAKGKEAEGDFQQIASVDIGDVGAAEISTFDPKTNRLFVVNNSGTNKIDVLDFSNPAAPLLIHSISVAPFGGLVNSLDVEDGMLAAAIESVVKTDPGKVVIFRTSDYAVIKQVTVGALPDMITYTPDGKFILAANEGEPNADYSVDPLGTVSLISVKDNYAVTTLDFSSFAGMQNSLTAKGLRIFGPGASFAQDIEPEYITVADDSRTAWVTLQENNAIAKIDLRNKLITDIFPLGFKNYNLLQNAIDPSDRPRQTPPVISFNPWPVYGMYQPDGIAVLMDKNMPYLFTANEGDARDYDAFGEEVTVGELFLNGASFANPASLQMEQNLGRLTVTNTLGNGGNEDYEALYSFGARSFSVFNGLTGALVYDSKNELEKKAVAAGLYDDGRSDNKGVEPEGITLGVVNKRTLAFIGMERADAVAIYDVTNPVTPKFLQILQTGDAPEGVLFISEKDSPTKRSLLLVSSEGDGVIRVYSPRSL